MSNMLLPAYISLSVIGIGILYFLSKIWVAVERVADKLEKQP